MCGITGFISQKYFNQLKQLLPDMASTLLHRGPDDSGFFFDKKTGVGFAHKRLSVIDLTSGGHQPMQSEDGRITIVYNGEIYNYRYLRVSLEQVGYQFRSKSDTEVVLKAYQKWGLDCFKQFIGMFALAIWDGHKRRLILARDRLGIKPLYYYQHADMFLFASELKALMANTLFPKEIDLNAIPLFLHYQYISCPRTIFKNTYKVRPGSYLLLSGQDKLIQYYWRLPEISDSNTIRVNESESINDLDDLLTDSVSNRLISDVPLGALLSGGIDSSLVVALMKKTGGSPVKTFSIGFINEAYNEAPWAARIAQYLKADHTELYVTPNEAMNAIPRLSEIYDEPFADASVIPTVLVSQLARSQVTVVLSGDGGDEQFAGYVRYWTVQMLANSLKRTPGFILSAASKFINSIPPNWIEKCYHPWQNRLPQRFQVTNFQDKWQKLIQLMGDVELQELYRSTICVWSKNEVKNLIFQEIPTSQYEEFFNETNSISLLSKLMRVDLRTYLPDAMLTKIDRASMAVGLEVRVPLLDHRVVEYSSRLPESLKYRNGSGKYLLKRLLARYVPLELFQRPKMGFGVPIAHWFRGELKHLVLDYLSEESLRKEGLFDPVFVRKKISEHLSGQINHQYKIWSLLMWEMWKERWLG